MTPTPHPNQPQAVLLGIGMDCRDEHKRITKGENFLLVGGSEETHDRMTETAIKVNEKLHERGKTLADASGDELGDIIAEAQQ